MCSYGCDCGNSCVYCSRHDADCGCCVENYFVIKTIFLNPTWPDAVRCGPMRPIIVSGVTLQLRYETIEVTPTTAILQPHHVMRSAI
ncbi:hypothetical protein Lalb_Chr17g0336361 [Lupinus albus]|uniref:Uncharacterized protein n=1 Tax=Lupinus albus TaxID=3870 RepID=A0A6A4NND6_LUPAL|nr:hypothetical protein Lalb_Chr17g0336361 [Lupinus albus]